MIAVVPRNEKIDLRCTESMRLSPEFRSPGVLPGRDFAMNQHLITLIFILAALAFYAMGLALPATGFLVLGAILEAVFWVRLFRGRRTGRTE
jgi:hypothetical protein